MTLKRAVSAFTGEPFAAKQYITAEFFGGFWFGFWLFCFILMSSGHYFGCPVLQQLSFFTTLVRT